jgi:predicted AlkP superfamily phosphohydrolase/phosphomutase
MSRLVVLGVDGMDWPLLEKLMPELPVIQSIARRGYAGEMLSIFPPDSIPSWVSIFTGLDPSEHGIIETIDYFKKDIAQFSVNTDAFRGRTFWDLAGALGKRVIVVNPLLAYPPWDVNGIMAAGPVFISGDAMVRPEEIAREYPVPPLGGIVDFPEKHELPDFARKTQEESERMIDFTLQLMRSHPWDLVFLSLLTMDRIFHFFWRFFDADDPTHPAGNEHADVIRNFHRFIDSCAGRLLDAAGDDCMLLILSDHGHHRRPTRLFNLNELLLQHGLLNSRIRGPRFLSPRFHLERTKNVILETLHNLDLEDLAYRFARVFPWTRKMKKRDFMTEAASNLATASEFGGTNPFGGVDISRGRCAVEGVDYEQMRDTVITLLARTRDECGKPVFLWVKRREELYRGTFIEKYPDVVYEMQPQYGTNWSLHVPLVTINPRHRKISGGHRKNSVLVAGPLNGGWEALPERISPLNVAATVLSVLAGGDAASVESVISGRGGRRPFLARSGTTNR